MFKTKLRFIKIFQIFNKKICEIYISKSNNIVYNLAVEEYFFDHREIMNPILFLYQNSKTVVIGKHQNPWKECNITLMENEGVNLSRRKSGGGAVYQDLGNLCFSFLSSYDPKLDFKNENNKIIISALKNLNINAVFSGRNDILVNDKKISGSAYKLNLGKNGYKAVSLHHGTILLNVDVERMNRYLNPNKLKLISKGVDSVRSRVVNLLQIDPNLSVDSIYNSLESEFLIHYGHTQSYKKIFIEDENSNTNEIIDNIFKTTNAWNWKFGETPEFTNSISHKFEFGLVDLSLKVEKGIINQAVVYSDSLHTEYMDIINNHLKNSSNKYSYDKKGMEDIYEDIKGIIPHNDNYLRFSHEIFNEFINLI